MWQVIETDAYAKHEKIVLETEDEDKAVTHAFNENAKQTPEGPIFIVRFVGSMENKL